MREIIFLNFGNSSNFISTHFWNLNDEMFKFEDKFNVDTSVFYNEYSQPRNIIFDYSENIRPYFMSNERLSDKAKKEIEDEVKIQNKSRDVKTFDMDTRSSNKFLDMINEIIIDDEEYSQYKKDNKNKIEEEEEVNTKKDSIPLDEIIKLPDDKIYEYFDFQNSIKNWNDFLQPRFNKKSFNEIMTADVDIISRGSYIKGAEFLSSDNYCSFYLDSYEDNFRKFLEDCDKLELLHFNVDFNSFWGGISSKMLEIINDSVPKVLKIIYGIDSHSSFYDGEDTFNHEKMLNYLWYFTDLNEHKESNVLFLPIYKHQNPSIIKNTFEYSLKPGHDPVYDYFFTSLCGANLHNLYMPLRSKYFYNTLNNLIHTTSSSLNFFESDTIIGLENKTSINNLNTNGLFFNFSRNIKSSEFSWKKLLDNSTKLNKFNSTVLHGYNEKYTILGEKIDGFLMKHSGISYNSIDHFNLPMCFPRQIKLKEDKKVFLNNLSIMTNYRPFPEFALNNLGYFPEHFKDYDSDIRKYLSNHDTSKYIEYKEKIEEYFKLVDSYDFINESYDLMIKGVGEEEEDEYNY